MCICLVAVWASRGGADEPVPDAGFLFLDGRYIPLPYRCENLDGSVAIPGTDFSLMAYVEASPASRNYLTGRSRRRLEGALRQVCTPEPVAHSLVALFNDAPPIILHQPADIAEALTLLTNQRDSGRAIGGRPEFLPEDFPLARWNCWAKEFQGTEEFSSRAQSYIARIDELEQDNRLSMATFRYAESSQYPLSVLGMLMVVLSFGHLLSCHPSSDAVTSPQSLSSATNRVICRTLILVFVLSVLDLLWTILAIRTGGMREINPLGSHFVDDPMSMTLFKASATALAVFLLYTLRHHLLARKAAWWVCLVCTLVAARWVTFNSMFVP
ncbi:MAG: DUF5658 family protein [Planctomycetaceae bacterium]